MYTSLCFTPRRYPLLHGPSALSLSILFSVFLPSLYPSFIWQCVSHHISVGCLDLSHWCLPHKCTQSNVCTILYCMLHPFEHLSPTVFSKAYCSHSMGTTRRTCSIIRGTCSVQCLVTPMYKGWDGAIWKRRFKSVCFPPDKGLLQGRGIKRWPFSDSCDFHSPSNY